LPRAIGDITFCLITFAYIKWLLAIQTTHIRHGLFRQYAAFPRTKFSAATLDTARPCNKKVLTVLTGGAWSSWLTAHSDTLHSGLCDHRGRGCGVPRLWARALKRIRLQRAALVCNYISFCT
jgi:hypothetical protein